MFFRKNKKINPATVDSIIGEGTTFDGKLTSEATVHIHGETKGHVEGKGQIMVGELGNVHSTLGAEEITVSGKVHGDVTARGKLIISSTGKVYGDTNSPSLTIEEGGVFLGTSKMDRHEKEEK